MAAGDTWPSQKTVFTDPVTGRTVWRLTTDGGNFGFIHGAPGDQSSEGSAWSPDSTKICFHKYDRNSGTKPEGIYMMDVASGIETELVAQSGATLAKPVWARNGDPEIYYYASTGLRAVNYATYATRSILAGFTGEKIEVCVDGRFIACQPAGGGVGRVVTPSGTVHPNWGSGSPAGDDGAVWHPTDPLKLLARRGSQVRVWNVDTLAMEPASLDLSGPMGGIAHAALTPNGAYHFAPLVLTNLATGTQQGATNNAPHTNFNPQDGALGTSARAVLDWPDEAALLVCPAQEVVNAGSWRQPQYWAAIHYSTNVDNFAHPHPTYSWDGQYILWTSKMDSLVNGTPPGPLGSGNRTDLFLVVMASAPVANFSGTPLSGAAPLTVNFTDLSTNTPTSWLWGFGDSGSSTVQNPSYLYTAPGTYTVTLTATNAGGSDPEVKTAYITVTGGSPMPITNIRGVPGAAGATGATGATGSYGTWYKAAGVPSPALGINGDFYLESVTGDVYYKAGGVWT